VRKEEGGADTHTDENSAQNCMNFHSLEDVLK